MNTQTYFDTLESIVSEYLDSEQMSMVRHAYEVAEQAHSGQFRSSGEPYITHPVAVAEIIAGMKLDYTSVMAALLHDVIEDTPYTEEQLKEIFGTNVAHMVDGVSKLDKLKFRTRQEAIAESFKKMILAMTKDIRVIIIKLADRTHNMRTLGSLRTDKKKRIALETLEIYIPIAHRLGIANIKNELERLCFFALHPYRYNVLRLAVNNARNSRKDVIEKIINDIRSKISELNISIRIFGREKPIYLLYEKLKLKQQQFNSIMDIYHFNLITENVDDCYRILGLVHTMYKPKPGLVKDYIAVPKANGYQSLQTSLIGKNGLPVEIHIYTEKMFNIAEMGIVNYWTYDTIDSSQNKTDNIFSNTKLWLQSLIELQQNTFTTFDFIDGVKADLFPEEIYVFTPQGKIIALPVGSTPIDFAYAVHSDVGLKCIGARVDHTQYPLSQPLESGQTVEIITSDKANTNVLWLNFVVTAKAKSEIKKRLKNIDYDESVKLGKELLLKALDGVKIEDIPRINISKLVKKSSLHTFDDVLYEIGIGNKINYIVAKQLLDQKLKIDKQMHQLQSDTTLFKIATCCNPIPDDPIIAEVSKGTGIYIHYLKCRKVGRNINKNHNIIPITWDNDARMKEYHAELNIQFKDTPKALSNLITEITQLNSHIISVNTNQIDIGVYELILQLIVSDTNHLEKIIKRVKNLSGITQIKRHFSNK